MDAYEVPESPQHAPWMDQALCVQTDPEAFFPEPGGPNMPAKQVCAACPVAAESLTYALEHGVRYGIWGGLSPLERQRLTRGAA